MYRFTREETEAAIAKLAELYPKCFFVEGYQRRPLVKTVLSDLEKDGVPLSFMQIKATVDWYQNSWAYLHNVKAGMKRITLLGEERAAVTAAEERNAVLKLAEDKKRIREEKEDRSRYEVQVTPMAKKPLPPSPPPAAAPLPPPPGDPMDDPFAYLLKIVEDARRAHEAFPEAIRQPMVLPTLRAIEGETQRLITDLENGASPQR
jgi:sRNA-binding protein